MRAPSLLLAMVGLAACAGGAPPPPRALPNVLLVTLDTTRADHLGPYGHPMARTPALDALAAEGVVFERHFTTAPITLPAHISILTGLWPPTHGVRDNGAYALSDEATTLPERLAAEGYATAAFLSAAVLDSRYNLDQGFEVYDDELSASDAPALFMIRERPGARTADAAIAWLDAWAARAARPPFMAWLHLFDPHQPMTPSAWDRASTPTAYDAEIAGADRALGRVIEALRGHGVLDDTVVVVTADHGESLGEHGEATHAVFIYDATMHVPLLLRWPGAAPAGLRVAQATSAVDLAPTLLSLLGLPPLDTQGLDLSPALRGEALPARPLYMESLLSQRGFGMAPLQGLRQDPMVWIRAPRPERYDTAADPRQLHDLHPEAPGPGEAMDAALQALLDAAQARAIEAEANPMSTETREMLMAMGYLARPEDIAAAGGVDPKDGMRLLALLEAARHATRAGELDEARAHLEALLAETPGNVSARNTLGYVLLQAGEVERAREEYARSLDIDPRQHRTLSQLAAIARQQGDDAEARRLLEQALAITPDYVEAMVSLGVMAWLDGDAEGAEAWHQRALAVEPDATRLWRDLGDLRYRQGRWEEALSLYQRVVAQNPQDFNAWLHSGSALLRLGQPAASLEATARAAALRPDFWMPPYNRACALVALARPDEAMAALSEAAALGGLTPRLLTGDPDLAALHSHPGWEALLLATKAEASSK